MPVTQPDQRINALLLVAHSRDRPGDLIDVDFSSGEAEFSLYMDTEAFRLTSRETPHPVFNSVRVRFYPDSEAGGVWFDSTASVGNDWAMLGPSLIAEAGNPAAVNRRITDALLRLARQLARH